jgi:CBS domain-containing protein
MQCTAIPDAIFWHTLKWHMSAVSEIISPKRVVAITLESNPWASDVTKLMLEKNISSVVITSKDGKPIGIITERDIIRKIAMKNKVLKTTAVRDIMSTPLITIKAYDSIETAAAVMAKNKIKRLVVLEEGGSLAGVLSVTDINTKLAKILANEYKRYSVLKATLDTLE